MWTTRGRVQSIRESTNGQHNPHAVEGRNRTESAAIRVCALRMHCVLIYIRPTTHHMCPLSSVSFLHISTSPRNRLSELKDNQGNMPMSVHSQTQHGLCTHYTTTAAAAAVDQEWSLFGWLLGGFCCLRGSSQRTIKSARLQRSS